MAPIVLTIDIACPPQEVFAYATDPARFAGRQRDVLSARAGGQRTARGGLEVHYDAVSAGPSGR